MKAIMLVPGQIEVHEVEVPTLGQDEMLLHIQCIGVCSSDIHVYHDKHPLASCLVVQGHEFSAVLMDGLPLTNRRLSI